MRLQVAYVPGPKTKWITVRLIGDGPLSPHHQYKVRKAALPCGPRGRNLRPGDILETTTDPYELAATRQRGGCADLDAVLVSAVSY